VAALAREAAFAFTDLGCSVEEIEAALPATSEADFIAMTICEMVAANEERLEEYKAIAYPLYLPFLDLAAVFTGKDIVRILYHRYQLWEAVRKIFDGYDLLLTRPPPRPLSSVPMSAPSAPRTSRAWRSGPPGGSPSPCPST